MVSADFTVNITTGTNTVTVTFTDLSTGNPTAWAWDYGDGITSTVPSPTHIYARAGVYTVVLTAYDGLLSDTKTKEEYIRVSFSDSYIKYSYIHIEGRLGTVDIAPPLDRLDLQTMYAEGAGNYLFIRKGIRCIIPKSGTVVTGSGFKRVQGPSVLFD